MATKGKEEATKTYIEQTKLLVTLASAFIIPPAVLFGLVPSINTDQLLWAESLFIVSTVTGYVVLGTVTGSQADESFDPYRLATRIFSLIQFFTYIAGLIVFIFMASAISHPSTKKAKETTTINLVVDENSKQISAKLDTTSSMLIITINSTDTLKTIKTLK